MDKNFRFFFVRKKRDHIEPLIYGIEINKNRFQTLQQNLKGKENFKLP